MTLDKEKLPIQNERQASGKNIRTRKQKRARPVKKAKKPPKVKVKREKSELYIIRKNAAMRTLRVFFWVMLAFIFVKGVIVSIRPDPTVEVNKTISDFKADFSGYKEQDNEVLSFAQNFAKEFLTYGIREESDYLERLKPYVAANILNTAYKFNGGAKALYTQAYKKDTYSDSQVDVYVLAQIEYMTKEISDDKSIIKDKTSVEEAVLKIPVKIKDNHYIIEDMPAFVSDDIKISDYKPDELAAKEVSREETEAIKQALSNFFKAYYEEKQSVINYYLTKDADKDTFRGLNKRVLFNKIDAVKCYAMEESSDIIALITVVITDINGVAIPQKFNLKVILKDNQYYIKEMNTRNVNINIKAEVIDNV